MNWFRFSFNTVVTFFFCISISLCSLAETLPSDVSTQIGVCVDQIASIKTEQVSPLIDSSYLKVEALILEQTPSDQKLVSFKFGKYLYITIKILDQNPQLTPSQKLDLFLNFILRMEKDSMNGWKTSIAYSNDDFVVFFGAGRMLIALDLFSSKFYRGSLTTDVVDQKIQFRLEDRNTKKFIELESDFSIRQHFKNSYSISEAHAALLTLEDYIVMGHEGLEKLEKSEILDRLEQTDLMNTQKDTLRALTSRAQKAFALKFNDPLYEKFYRISRNR